MKDWLDELDKRVAEKSKRNRNSILLFLVYIVAWGFFVYWITKELIL